MSKIHTEEGYCRKILEKLWQQCESEDFCDVVLIAGTNEKRIPAHRLILSVSSEYFRGMFSSSMLESTKKEIELPSVDGDALQSLVEYCHKGSVVISEDVVEEMLKTADMLFLGNVVIVCANFLEDQLHPSNCLGFTLLAEQYRCETLLQKAKDYSLEYFTDVCKADEFLSLNAEHLSQLLGSDELCISAEEEIFESVIQWIGHDPDEREICKEELLRLVRMPLLERSYLVEQVKPFCKTSAECFQMYVEAIESQLLSDQKNVKHRNSTRDEFLMAIAHDGEVETISIHYYCPQQLKWMQCSGDLEYCGVIDVGITREHVYIILECQDKSAIYLNLRTMTSYQLNSMKEYRYNCRAILLKESIYVIGGYEKSSCEKWNPKTNSWSYIASMSTERCYFGCIILNEKIYVVGGSGLNTAECFDPDNNVWTNVASMSTERYGCGIANLNDKIYVIGGYCGNEKLNTAEYYDPDKNVWTDIACMNRHSGFLKVASLNGMLYVVGGHADDKTVERYDPTSNKWTVIRYFSKVFNCTCYEITSFRNKVVVYCDDRFEEYDPETNEWKAGPTSNGITISNIKKIFSYSGQLRISEFVENLYSY